MPWPMRSGRTKRSARWTDRPVSIVAPKPTTSSSSTANRALPHMTFASDSRLVVDVQAVNDHVDRRPVRRRDRGDRGGDPQRARRGGDDDRSRRLPPPRPLPHDRLLETMARFGRPARMGGRRELTMAERRPGRDQAGGRGRHPTGSGDLRGARQRRPGRDHRCRGAVPPAPAAVGRARVAVEDEGGGRLSGRRSRPGRSGPPRRPLRPAGPDRPGHRPAAARGRVRDASRRTTFASDDPAALPIYVRAGMPPRWASLYVEGPAERLAPPPATIRTEMRPPMSWRRLERSGAATTDGGPGHWAAQCGRRQLRRLDGEQVVASASGRARQPSTIRVLNRLVVHPDAAVDPVPATLAALTPSRPRRRHPRRRPGPSARSSGPCSTLGFRIADRDQFMASEPDLFDPARLIPNPGML